MQIKRELLVTNMIKKSQMPTLQLITQGKIEGKSGRQKLIWMINIRK